jgi:hypothetical protein
MQIEDFLKLSSFENNMEELKIIIEGFNNSMSGIYQDWAKFN